MQKEPERKMMDERRPKYEAAADIVVANDEKCKDGEKKWDSGIIILY